MTFGQISGGGELFELMRPATLVVSALLSTWVLASGRRHGFKSYLVAAWALGTLFFPFIILPIYLIARHLRRLAQSGKSVEGAKTDTRPAANIRWRVFLPLAYGLAILSVIFFGLYRDHRSLDAHLARATRDLLNDQQPKAIDEYRAALVLEDSPHTHKLLGVVLAEERRWTEALSEFRLAERGGEPDELLPFRIGTVLETLEHRDEASLEYERFLNSRACMQKLPIYECGTARMRLQLLHPASKS